MFISPENLIALAVFAAITLGTWSVLGLVATRPKSAELRLKRLLDPRAVEIIQAKRQEQVQARVAAAAGKLGKSLRPSNEHELGKIRIKLLNAGFRQEQAVAVFFGIKLILLLIALAAAFPPAVIYLGMTQKAYMVTACAGGVAFYLPDFLVGRRRKSRGESIFMGLPDALDLMVVCVEAGLGLDAAMRRVTERTGPVEPGALRGVCDRQFSDSNGAHTAGCAPRPGYPHRCRRRTGAGRRDHPGREVWLEHRGGVACSIRRHASEAPAVSRGPGRRDVREDHAPLDLLHFPRRVCRARRPGGPQHERNVRHQVTGMKWFQQSIIRRKLAMAQSSRTSLARRVAMFKPSIMLVEKIESPHARPLRLRMVLLIALGIFLVPLVVEAAAICYSQWCEVMGRSSEVRTPLINAIGEGLVRAENRWPRRIGPTWDSAVYDPSIALPVSSVLIILAMAMLRR